MCLLRIATRLCCGAMILFAPLLFQPLSLAAQGDDATPPAPHTLHLPLVARARPLVVIGAAYIDSAISQEPDEALLLWNIGDRTQPLAGWQLAAGTRAATFPLTSTLQIEPGQRLWCTAQAAAFRASFGESPACEWAADTDPDVPNLEGRLGFANTGGLVTLYDAMGEPIDRLVYGNADDPATGWSGPPAALYTRGLTSTQGQLWQRKRDAHTGLPIDTDRASDWAGDLADLTWGRQVRWPGWQGWDAAGRARPAELSATAAVTVAVGPEGLQAPIAATLRTAVASIDLSIYTLEHPALATTLADAARRGVRVRIMLEGSPPGGISDLQKWCVAQVATAGGDVRYHAVAAVAPNGYKKRYRFAHAKYGIVDGRIVLVGTDNFNLDSMPAPSRTPVGGRRGFYLFTEAAPVVAALQRVFDADWAPDRFLDLRPFDLADPKYGGPPAGFTLPEAPIYVVADAPFRSPVAVREVGRFVVVCAPENALRPDTGLNALIARAGAGDEVLLMQLYENKHWGETTSNPVADPNPRLEMLIDAARRGARVRLLLDSFFDDGEDLRSNRATVDYVRAIAAAEGLDLDARLGNPTGGGIHAKLVLVRVGGEHWSAVGSLNGSEVSHKINREVVLLMDHPIVYHRLQEVVLHDWALTTR
jgi:cardiolipin synthase A/B